MLTEADAASTPPLFTPKRRLCCFSEQDRVAVQQTGVPRVEPPDAEVGRVAGRGHAGHQRDAQVQRNEK